MPTLRVPLLRGVGHGVRSGFGIFGVSGAAPPWCGGAAGANVETVGNGTSRTMPVPSAASVVVVASSRLTLPAASAEARGSHL